MCLCDSNWRDELAHLPLDQMITELASRHGSTLQDVVDEYCTVPVELATQGALVVLKQLNYVV